MSMLAKVLFSRATLLTSALILTASCGGTPSVTGRPTGVDTPGAAAEGATGGTGGSTGGTGGTGIVVGGQGGEDNQGGAAPDPCAGPTPPDWCGMLQPSGPACGDGELNQDDEDCDDGNSLPGDGCSGVCQVEPYYKCPDPGMPCESTIACGDGVIDPGEFCDDGNTDDDDGCSADCEMQDPSYVCPEAGQPCKLLYDCGDGRVNGSEECDDGNAKSGDGCSSKCKGETGYVCRRPGKPCELNEYCGDGIIQDTRGEECDDGNADFGDGCSTTCQVEPYFDCPTAGEPCVSTIVCGDGVRDPGEECDDGNMTDGDGCSAVEVTPGAPLKCKIDQGYICATVGEACIKGATCGDGRLSQKLQEECDDGNNTDGDGCSADCKKDPAYICAHPGQLCVLNQYCGDGVVQASLGEQCDDGNNDYTDGCYGDCKIAPYFTCPTAGQPCVSTIVCGDSKRDPGEACDDGNNSNGDGCASDCTPETNWKCTGPAGGTSTCTKLVDCGDKRVSGGEECDDGNKTSNDGCSSSCLIEAGYTCATPGSACTQTVVCGDGKRAASEQCDDGGTIGGDGCSGQCKIENDWTCSGAVGAKSTCTYNVVCGDGKLDGNEVCDDGNKVSGDGCASNCMTVETGFKCARAGFACIPICGDGILKGTEQCDIASPNATDALACVKCRLTAGYQCNGNTTGSCSTTKCPNGVTEPGESCDDNNTVAGDGCSPTCQKEPTVTVGKDPVVSQGCGDGMITGSETCDDGNKDKGDGCDDTCHVENGWSCSGSVQYPDSIKFKIQYRDFKQRDVKPGGHPHMKVSNVTPPNSGFYDPGIVGALCTVAAPDACGRLDSAGKPAYVGGVDAHLSIDTSADGFNATYHTAAFALWYRDTNAAGTLDQASQAGTESPTQPIDISVLTGDTLTLTKTASLGQPATKASYQFSSTSFFPLDNRGFGNTAGQSHNFQFTSELRYFFQYQGGETLTFYGDDDVWVFINGRLAVDIGGIHVQYYGRVILGDDGADGTQTESNCSVNGTTTAPAACALQGAEATDGTDKRFGLTKGNLYEIVVFQAERHPTGSDYQLTLDGFLAPRSTCSPVCGVNPSGQTPTVTLTPPEECDDGANNTATPQYGKCTTSCQLGPYCGDAVKNGSEACDNGSNTAQYGQSGCAPGCVLPATCGDGNIDTPFEQCDNGSSNSATGYGGCKTDCTIGPRCGDGVKNGPETCDDGVNDGSYGGCTPTCGDAPKCGDGNVDTAFGEVCDGGAGCDAFCQLKCGNGIVDAGEQCDDGILAGGYGRCAAGCVVTEFCGDGVRSGPEECDLGTGNNTGAYGGCTAQCKLGPSCGDGVVNGTETCDDGKNDGFYEGCNPDCTPGPRCKDGVLDTQWGEQCDDVLTPTTCMDCSLLGSCGDHNLDAGEQCDDGVDNTPTPVYGQCLAGACTELYCGDNHVDGPEECDNGADNSDTAYNGCTTRCKQGPYCGDGHVDKPDEKCDDGVNDDFYGSCTPDCKGFGPRCGDNVVQPEWGEECDDQNDANCMNCRLGAQCGDGVVQSGEDCDDGINDGGYGECGPKCTYGPRCGDGVKNGPEQCDDGEGNNTGAYGKCAPGCVYGPYCGDGKVTKPYEECDDKNNKNGDGCSAACKKETVVPK